MFKSTQCTYINLRVNICLLPCNISDFQFTPLKKNLFRFQPCNLKIFGFGPYGALRKLSTQEFSTRKILKSIYSKTKKTINLTWLFCRIIGLII